MCVIIWTQKKSLVTLDLLKDAHTQNPDGWGLMYPGVDTNGAKRMFTTKWYHENRTKQWDTFKEVWAQVPDDVQIGIHFRIKTHGDKSVANSHPFEVLRWDSKKPKSSIDLWMMHNGTISISSVEKDDTRSDTAIFVDAIVKPQLKIHKDFLEHSSFRLGLKFMVGSHNKLLFMDSLGRMNIINEQAGTWEEKGKLWFSNTHFKRHTHSSNTYDYNTGHYGHSRGSHADWIEESRKKESRQNANQNQLLKTLLGREWKEEETGVWKYIGPQSNVVPINSSNNPLVVASKEVPTLLGKSSKEWLPSVIADIEENFLKPEYTDKVVWMRRMCDEQFPVMTKAEILEWIDDYSLTTADWMVRHGYSGGRATVAFHIMDPNNQEEAVDWIYNRSRNLKNVGRDDDEEDNAMFAMYGYGM